MVDAEENIDILWVVSMRISLWNLCWMIDLVSIDDTLPYTTKKIYGGQYDRKKLKMVDKTLYYIMIIN